MDRLKQAKLKRIERAELQLKQEVKALTTAAHVALKESDLSTAKKHIRRASLLDVNSVHSAEISELKHLYLKSERDQKFTNLVNDLKKSLEREEFRHAELMLSENADFLNENQGSVLSQLIEKSKSRTEEAILEQLDQTLENWNLDDSEKLLIRLKECTDDTQWRSSHREVTDLKNKHNLAMQIANKVSEDGVEEFSVELFMVIEEALINAPQHPALIGIKKSLQAQLDDVEIPGRFATIEEALQFVPEGSHIHLGEGVFYARLALDGNIQISGVSPQSTIIEGNTRESAVVSISDGETKISNLTIRGVDGLGTSQCSAIKIIGSEAELDNVTVEHAFGHGVEIHNSSVRLINNTLRSNGGSGLAVYGENSKVEVSNSKLAINGLHGIDLWGGASGIIKNSQISSNANSGCLVTGAGTICEIVDSRLSNNTHCGTFVGEAANISLRESKVRNNAHSGVVGQGVDTLLKLTEVEIQSNQEYGVIIDPQSKLQMVDSKMDGNELGEKLVRKLK